MWNENQIEYVAGSLIYVVPPEESKLPITLTEWNEQFVDDSELLDMLDRNGVIVATGLDYRKGRPREAFPRWYQPPSYKTPYDYFLRNEREEDMAEQPNFEFRTLDVELSERIERLIEREVQLKRTMEDAVRMAREPFDAALGDISAEIARSEAALQAYNSRPETLDDDEDTALETPKVGREALMREMQEPLAPTPGVSSPRLPGARKTHLTPKERTERDHLKTLVVEFAADATVLGPGDITIPMVATKSGMQDRYNGRGSRRWQLEDAFRELEAEGRLAKTSRRLGGIGRPFIYQLVQTRARSTSRS